MRFFTAAFPILLTLAAADGHYSCACNSITPGPGTYWAYNWELTKYACKHNYAGQFVAIGVAQIDGDQWLKDCRRAGTIDGYYRYNKDDTLDLSTTLWVWMASSTCD
ncbi:hypothetical protein E4U09_004275 [Claviceps aff. purpurea]|uniref:Cyanovirin-N domain-containing protein n=1 Tax=Claviceps aff. purpurea TaxID=1967640 RepID=A0A9P7TXE8_9HYPO|nr:hypothetical protein E4U09_004275 [Claviceps aff. purpurea]